jgi:transposase InsO family protein
MLDDAAEVNVISQSIVLQCNLRKVDVPLPNMEGFRGEKGHCYGAYKLRMRIADSTGAERMTDDVFFSVDLSGSDVLLGRPWRRKYGIVVDSRNDLWWFSEPEEMPAARVRDARAFQRDLRKAAVVYAVNIKAIQDMPDLPEEIKDYSDVITSGDVAHRALPTGVDHAIDLEPGQRPPFRPLYNLSTKELEALREYLDQALKNGWIKRSVSEAGAPILFVPKKDGSLRLCVDYRGLNSITIKNRHPLPLISETLDRLGEAKVFSALDLKDAYYRIPIKRGDSWKTAFRTRYGHFEYNVMPFGLTNAPATFQAYINRALAGLVDVCCVVYLDDILVYSDTHARHVRDLRAVLERLRKFALYASWKKCKFFTDEVAFLGYTVGSAGVSMDRSRVATVEEWPTPTSFRDVQVFLGFANFYRRFIRNYSKIVAPLTSLSKGSKNGKKTGPLVWGASEEQAFRQVKDAFTEAPILRHFDPAAPLRMETDASGFAVSAILSQMLYAGEEHAGWYPIAFWSRKLIPAECNYETHDGELLAIVEGFKQFRHYLEGATHATQVLTDHNNLRGFMGVKQLNGRQARWATFLAAFDFVIEHRAGKTNPADAPSRRPDYACDERAPSHLLPTLQNKLAVWKGDLSLAPTIGRVQAQEKHLLGAGDAQEYRGRPAMVRAVVNAASRSEDPFSDPTADLTSVIQALQSKDDTLSSLQKRSERAGETDAWSKHGGLWYFNKALYVPDDSATRAELMRVHHDDELAGHFGRNKTEELLRRKYYWPGLSEDVARRVASCSTCQIMKARRHRPYGDAQALRMPQRAWEEITLDFITDLPPSKLNSTVVDSILVIVDRYTKMNIFVPTTKRCDSVELAKHLMDAVVRRYGVPKGILSDRGSLFTSQYWSDFAYEARVKHKLSTAFHPQTDGQTERMNQTLEQYLRCYCSEAQDSWAEMLAHAEFAVNNSVHNATRMSPFSVLYGWNPEIRGPPIRDELHEERVPAAGERARQMREAHDTLAKRWSEAQESQVKSQNKRQKPMQFKVGDRVLLSTKNLRLPGAKKKLSARFVGPFQIRDVVGSQAYRLALPTSYKIHNVFHVSLLELWNQRAGEEPAQPMPLAVEADAWEVAAILGAKKQGGQQYYLVQWKDWPEEYNSWEPEANCTGATRLIEAYSAQRTRRKRA